MPIPFLRISLALVCVLAFLSSGKADSVPDILERMDKDAPAFHALTADLAMDTYQKIIDSHTPENGSLKMQRSPKGEVKAVIEFTGNSARRLSFQGKNVQIYYPAINEYQVVSLGSNAGVVNQFLLLGFGSSGHELQQSYTITAEGEENVSGLASTKLLLVPKDKAVLEKLPKVELWIPAKASSPIQQEFYEPSGNYRLITYSNMHVNPPMPGNLDLKLPKNARKQPK